MKSDMPGKFAENPYYVEYETLLKRLHELNATGAGDSEEADLLRDEMDRPYSELSYEEVERLRGLSADLHMLDDSELYEPLQPGEDPVERSPERLMERFRDAWTQGDAETALTVMRLGPLPLDQAQIAYLRAEAYEQLGHPDTALFFAQYAAQLAPEDGLYPLKVLRLLSASGRSAEARAPTPEHATPT
jgi:hypothetical protein